MDWEEDGIHRKFQIWTRQLRGGAWVSSVAAMPKRGVMAIAVPGEQGPPGEFKSKRDAIEAARKYIDKIQGRRRGGHGKEG